MAIILNTVRITGSFVTWAGSLSDAEEPKLLVYEGSSQEPMETIELTQENHVSTGIYQVDYVIEKGRKELVFEITGLVEGTPETGRIAVDRQWLSE